MAKRAGSGKTRVFGRGLEAVIADRTLLPDSLIDQRFDRRATDPRLLQIFHEYGWHRRSRYVRSWLVWVACADLLLIVLDVVLMPTLLVPSLLIRGIGMTGVFALLMLAWSKPRGMTQEGASFVVATGAIMLCAGTLGMIGGAGLFEHYLTAGLFTISTAVVSFPIDFRWTVVGILVAMATYFVFLLFGPSQDMFLAVTMTVFYLSAILGLAAARMGALHSFWRSFLMTVRQARDREEMARLNEELRLAADIDPLTGIANRRWATRHIERVWRDERIAKSGIVFLMADIDHFKRLNDGLGHAAGDDCIRRVAASIAGSIRGGTDIVARYGGEEFLVMLTEASPATAWAIAERIRHDVAALALPGSAPATSPVANLVTISVGLAFARDGVGPEQLAKWADDGLYEAKRSGRNAVRTGGPNDLGGAAPPAPDSPAKEPPGSATGRNGHSEPSSVIETVRKVA